MLAFYHFLNLTDSAVALQNFLPFFFSALRRGVRGEPQKMARKFWACARRNGVETGPRRSPMRTQKVSITTRAERGKLEILAEMRSSVVV